MPNNPSPFTCSSFYSIFSYEQVAKMAILAVNVLKPTLHHPSFLAFNPSPSFIKSLIPSSEGW